MEKTATNGGGENETSPSGRLFLFFFLSLSPFTSHSFTRRLTRLLLINSTSSGEFSGGIYTPSPIFVFRVFGELNAVVFIVFLHVLLRAIINCPAIIISRPNNNAISH